MGYLRGFRHELEAQGLSKPVWITEMGWPTERPAWGWGDVAVTERVQAEYLVRSHVLGLAGGVDMVLWFQLEGADFGLLGPNGPKPALAAYAQMTRALVNRRFARRDPDANVRVYYFDGTDGVLAVAWAITPTRWSPGRFAITRAEDMLGRALPATTEPLYLQSSPVYLFGRFDDGR
jgi:hypothetical protein